MLGSDRSPSLPPPGNHALPPPGARQIGRSNQAHEASTRVIELRGGTDFFSNGIHLNVIEAATDPALESWRSINAIDDLVLEILNTMSHPRAADIDAPCRQPRAARFR
jgi:hypothetical protein